MNSDEFEQITCKILRKNGYWALNIPKNKSGAQPFDVIAIKRNWIYAIDCKVCGTARFALSRVEDNQWLAMEDIRKRADGFAMPCFWCYCEKTGRINIVTFETVKQAQMRGLSSIKLS